MSNPFDFLWSDEQEKEAAKRELPSGGDSLGFTGKWMANLCYRQYMAGEVTPKEREELGLDDIQVTRNGAFIYWNDREKAVEHENRFQYPANLVWRWTLKAEDVHGEVPEWFGDRMSHDVNVTTMMSIKRRHGFHLYLLPSVVQSMAQLVGFIDKPVFDYSTCLLNSDTITDEVMHEMTGTGSEYADAKLWQARAEIWDRLGETDPGAYREEGKHGAESEKLRQCLKVVTIPNLYMYATVLAVPSANETDMYTNDDGETAFRRTPVMLRLFKSAEEMQAEVPIAGGNATEVVETGDGETLPIPADFADYVDDWKDLVSEVIESATEGKKLARKTIEKKINAMGDELKASYNISPSDVIAWIDEV